MGAFIGEYAKTGRFIDGAGLSGQQDAHAASSSATGAAR